jgi:hypothetical protein
MKTPQGQHYPNQRVPGEQETLLGQPTAEDEQANKRILTDDGALAIDGGKLPGNKDDFDGEVDSHARIVAGAFGESHPPEKGDEVTPADHDKS